ncbi:MAG: PD40 domain-containing protein [Flavobacteriales bacterium]|nr:PD40 domain-containing protein [Flavobacteriales bacterium]
MNKLTVLSLAVLLSARALAQADPETLRRAQDAIKKADAHFDQGGAYFPKALKLYEEAIAVMPDDALLNLKVGLCHLNGRYHHRALPFFEKAAALDPTLPRVHFLLGYAYQNNAEWDKAIAAFEKHKELNRGTMDPVETYNQYDKHITECKYGRSFAASPVRAMVTNAGPRINSEVADYGVLISADGEQMMFTSRRSNTTGGRMNKATDEYFEDVYSCSLVNGEWTEPVPMAPPVNTNGNDASVGLYNDGRTLVIYRDARGTGDLYESRRKGDSWSEPEAMGANINTKGHESSAWYSFDRQWLYFVSDREGGIGGQDIWRSPWVEDLSDWGEPENLGPMVNTIHDEDGIFVHPDGRTIYFSSKGHTTMGGYDVFKSELKGEQWTKAVNLGWPVNGPDDDLYFVLTADGRTGYFSSVRGGGMGEDDIYRVDFLPEPPAQDLVSAGGGAPVPEAGEHASTVMIKGKVKDLRMLGGMEAEIDMLDLQDARLVARFSSDPSTGEFMVVVPGGREYAMHVRAKGYLFHSENIAVPATGEAGVNAHLNIAMQPIEAGSQVVMRNIFFERDKADLAPASLAELDRLLLMMRENPATRIEVGGHTDSDGSASHNDELSTARARAVADHLIANGIREERVEAKGYGATKPMAPNDTPQNKQLNRRTEVKVL